MNNKLVYESVDTFINEEKDPQKSGVIRNAFKYIKTAPGRSLRRKRARYVMQKYKIKIIKDIDKIAKKYKDGLSKLISRIENRILAVDGNSKIPTQSSKINIQARDEVIKSKRYEDILNDTRNTLEDVLTKLKDTCNKVIEHYAKAINDRLERGGTLTGVEFYPEEKVVLLNEWRSIEADINEYIDEKLDEFIDDIYVSQLEDIKSQLKQYIEQFSYYKSNSFNTQSNDKTQLDPDELNVLRFMESVKLKLGNTYELDIQKIQNDKLRKTLEIKNLNKFSFWVDPNTRDIYVKFTGSGPYVLKHIPFDGLKIGHEDFTYKKFITILTNAIKN